MHPVPSIANLQALPLDRHAAILCDLDGCLISGAHVYDGAEAFVARHSERLWIVSNNSSDTARTLSGRLAAMGLEIAHQRILLAGEQTLRRLAGEQAGRRVSLFAEAPLIDLARALGLHLDDESPEIVLLARQTAFDLRSLDRLVALIERGASLHVTNLDRTHPGADGRPVPETGALLAAVRACRPDIAFRSIGKPAPDLIEMALARAGVAAQDALFVGDNPETDGLAARAAGIAFIHLEAPGAMAVPAGVEAARNGRAAC